MANVKVPGRGPGKVLDLERSGASFEIDALKRLVYGGELELQRRTRLLQIVHDEPEFQKKDKFFLSRSELYEKGLRMTAKLLELIEKYKWSDEDIEIVFEEIDQRLPIGLHLSMFVPTIENQASEMQKEKWMPLIRNYSIIGTYAQTELGHGSFIRGLETTATLDLSTDEFVLNSPTLTSLKWWPGNLGKTVNHAVVLAQLIIKGKKIGLHSFLVPLRSMQDHSTLPGVELGDIGPKFGYEMVDNGFMRLTNVRIPRENMLMKYAHLDRNGNYSKAPHDKIGYGTMVLIRSQIIGGAAKYMGRAAVIATRYSAVRKQFPDEVSPSNLEETRVLDYPTQQLKIFPWLAASYILHFCGKEMMKLFQLNQTRLRHGDTSMMSELHANSACLKALSSEISVEAMEVCRKSCGGHGYSMFSGIIDAYQDWVPSQTYEGENTVMYLQTARYLFKNLHLLQSAKQTPRSGSSVGYLHEFLRNSGVKCHCNSVTDFLSPEIMVDIFKNRAGHLLLLADSGLKENLKLGDSFSLSWRKNSIHFVKAAQAHAVYQLFEKFALFLCTVTDTHLQELLSLLLSLFGCFLIEKYSGDFLESEYFNINHIKMSRECLSLLLSRLRPEAVALADSWDFSDYFLNSALGKYDGDVYVSLYDWAKKGPLNNYQVHPAIHKYLLPVIHKGKITSSL